MQHLRIAVFAAFLVAASSSSGSAWAGTSGDDQQHRDPQRAFFQRVNLRQPRHERKARHKREAVSFAVYRALVDLFPAQQAHRQRRVAGRATALQSRRHGVASRVLRR